MSQWQVEEVLKCDSFGRVERLCGPGGVALRRVACGARLPGSGLIARYLMRREHRALCVLAGHAGTPELVDDALAAGAASSDGSVPHAREVLLRDWVAGQPLHLTESLALDFFDQLDALVEELHARGVCHNDLHKEQNIMVGADGYPYLIDFQLASVHERRGALYRSRVRDDLRHVQKHRRRYTRDGRGPGGGEVGRGAGYGVKRGGVALLWRRTGKPLYNFVTRRLLKTRDGELRRASAGPWPQWTEAVGRRE